MGENGTFVGMNEELGREGLLRPGCAMWIIHSSRHLEKKQKSRVFLKLKTNLFRPAWLRQLSQALTMAKPNNT